MRSLGSSPDGQGWLHLSSPGHGSSHGSRAQIWGYVSVMVSFKPVFNPTYRSAGYWTLVVFTPPRTRFQTRGTGDGAGFWTLVVNAALAAGLLALTVASLVLGMTWASAKVLAVQRAFARVLGVVHACNWSRPNCVNVQVQFLTLPTSSLALPRTATHRFVAKFGASGRGWVLVASHLFRMLAVWQLLRDQLLTFDRPQVSELVAVHNERSHSCNWRK